MVTLTDQVLLLWAFENYEENLTSLEMGEIEDATILGRWSSRNPSQTGSGKIKIGKVIAGKPWTNEGRRAFCVINKELRKSWENEDVILVGPDKMPAPATKVFQNAFKERWHATFPPEGRSPRGKGESTEDIEEVELDLAQAFTLTTA